MVEAILGGLVIAAAVVGGFALPTRTVPLEFWQAVTWSGAAFLAFGLVRDVAIKVFVKREGVPKRAGEKTLCFESIAGAFCVAAGLAILAAGIRHVWQVNAAGLLAYGGVLLVLSGVTKDLVIVFKREKNHMNLIPW